MMSYPWQIITDLLEDQRLHNPLIFLKQINLSWNSKNKELLDRKPQKPSNLYKKYIEKLKKLSSTLNEKKVLGIRMFGRDSQIVTLDLIFLLLWAEGLGSRGIDLWVCWGIWVL